MFRGLVIAVLGMLFAAQADRYLTNGRYLDGAWAVLRQIRHSFGV
jgi:hypothetical protein